MNTLVELLEARRLHLDEVTAWASAVAAELSTLHGQGLAHGAVAAETILIEGKSAKLMARNAGNAQADQPQDIMQFAALLRKMLEFAEVRTASERTQWNALERIAATNSHASEGSRMKKVAAALRLVRPARTSASLAPAIVPAAPRRARRVLLLVREVSPAERPPLPRLPRKRFPLGVLVASAASLALVGCLMLLRLVR